MEFTLCSTQLPSFISFFFHSICVIPFEEAPNAKRMNIIVAQQSKVKLIPQRNRVLPDLFNLFSDVG